MVRVLGRPEIKRWRLRMVLALIATVAAKELAVGAPVLLGDGINRVMAGADGTPRSFVLSFLLFSAARFLSNGLPQLRDAFFYRVTQEANRLVAVESFTHAQAQ